MPTDFEETPLYLHFLQTHLEKLFCLQKCLYEKRMEETNIFNHSSLTSLLQPMLFHEVIDKKHIKVFTGEYYLENSTVAIITYGILGTLA